MSICKIIAGNPQKRTIQVLEKNRGDCIVCQKQTQNLLIYVLEETHTSVLPLIIINAWSTERYPPFYGMMCNECNTVLGIVKEAETENLKQKYKFEGGLFSSKLHKKVIDTKTIEIRFAQTVEYCEGCNHEKDMHWQQIIERGKYNHGCYHKNCKCIRFK